MTSTTEPRAHTTSPPSCPCWRTAVGSTTLVSDSHVLTCANNGQTITLRTRTELIDKNIIRETVTGDNFFDEIIYHRVSQR